MDERLADRMREAVLLGNRDTKRTLYFQKAACQEGLPFVFLDWRQWREKGFQNENKELLVKLDPPVWESGRLEELELLTGNYRECLHKLETEKAVVYLNSPRAIAELLQKRSCKKRLKDAGIPVTEMFEKRIADTGELMAEMEHKGVRQVFIKPDSGSGAAGVTAFRLQPQTGKMAAYTCACLIETPQGKQLANTKKMRVLRERGEILAFLDHLFLLDCVVERWYPKADYCGESYDLRVVVQDGRMDFILARLGKGPITNLHLNNHPVEADKLNLPRAVIDSVEEVSRRAAGCVPGLRSVGIDLLLERGSLLPRVIEMNGQGDLLYQDIYSENRIYRRQAVMMKQWLADAKMRQD